MTGRAGMDSMYSSSAVVTALVVDNSSCTFSASGPGVDATRAERSRFSAADVFTAQRSFTLRGKRFSGVELHLDGTCLAWMDNHVAVL